MSDSGNWTPDLKENYEKYLKKPPGRHMRYPYTMTAQIVQFPYRYQFNTSYPFRWFIYASFTTMGIFYYINKLICTPANYELTKMKRQADEHYHYKRP